MRTLQLDNPQEMSYTVSREETNADEDGQGGFDLPGYLPIPGIDPSRAIRNPVRYQRRVVPQSQRPDGQGGVVRYYAGVGSRATPLEVQARMEDAALELGALGFTLRSGAAPGADTAFESGVLAGGYPAEVFLPWPGFEDRPASQEAVVYHETPALWAYRVAQQFHPNWNALSSGGAKLMARNSHQVFGKDEYGVPIEFAICYTPDGKGGGGTGQVIRICEHYRIPVLDLGNPKTWEVFAEALHYYIDEEPRGPRDKSTE